MIGNVRSPVELSPLARMARPLRPMLPLVPVQLLQLCCAPLASQPVQRIAPSLSGVARQFRYSDPVVLKWSLARILDWSATPELTCPVFHIHGDRDFISPIKQTRPDTIIAGGGHVISLTHPTDINKFIRSAMNTFH